MKHLAITIAALCAQTTSIAFEEDIEATNKLLADARAALPAKGSICEMYDKIGDALYLHQVNNDSGRYNKEVAALKKRFIAVEKPCEAKREKEAEAKKTDAERGVRIGMTKAQVLRSMWGEPSDINSTTTKHGTREQWVYGPKSYLYFENGVLVSIQN